MKASMPIQKITDTENSKIVNKNDHDMMKSVVTKMEMVLLFKCLKCLCNITSDTLCHKHIADVFFGT